MLTRGIVYILFRNNLGSQALVIPRGFFGGKLRVLSWGLDLFFNNLEHTWCYGNLQQ